MNEVYIDMRKENEWIRKYFDKDLVSIEELIGCIEDLDGEIDSLKEQIEDIKQDRDDNYKPISYYKQYAINEDSFH